MPKQTNFGFNTPGLEVEVGNFALPSMLESTNDIDVSSLRINLRKSILLCEQRGLLQASKWAAELLTSLPRSAPDSESNICITATMPFQFDDSDLSNSDSLPIEEYDLYLLAKNYFLLSQFDRCANVLKLTQSPLCLFIQLYAKYMAGEKRCQEETLHKIELKTDRKTKLDEPLGKKVISPGGNRELSAIVNTLRPLYERGELDPFCLYLYGLVLVKCQKSDDGMKVLIESVNNYPYNWSAWMELANCITNREILLKVENSIVESLTKNLFLIHLDLDFNRNSDSTVETIDSLLRVFPNSSYLESIKAIVFYNIRDFGEAEMYFDKLLKKDPYRLEHLDTFSNVLYVLEKKAKLSFLAHTACKVDKFQPETCCIVGNYYALRCEHEKAIQYFKRALLLNPKYLAAWTLMGHEYVELKNTQAAIESYRCAVDTNPRDYRAWYGLGQTYEVLRMPYYSLYYYQKATSLRPLDSRMWCALAGSYENLSRIGEALKCYKRALVQSENEVLAMTKLAKLYSEQGKKDEAAHYFRMYFDTKKQEEDNDFECPEMVEACLFLGIYEKERGHFKESENYFLALLHFNVPEKNEANKHLQEMGFNNDSSASVLEDFQRKMFSDELEDSHNMGEDAFPTLEDRTSYSPSNVSMRDSTPLTLGASRTEMSISPVGFRRTSLDEDSEDLDSSAPFF